MYCPIEFIVFCTVILVACIAALMADHIIRKERKEAEARLNMAWDWTLSRREPTCVHTPCGLGVELYKATDGVYSVCCYGRGEDCSGKNPECAMCPLKDIGMHEVQNGWTPEEELQSF